MRLDYGGLYARRVMVDIPSAEAVAGSALGLSVLKPSAELIGEKLRDNLDRVIRKAEKRLGPDGLKRQGEVPLRVLKAAREEGMVCESELEAEYLGGVLASSRTEISRDDRAASLIALIGRLSTYQLRTHYILYALGQRSLAGQTTNLGDGRERARDAHFFLPLGDWLTVMEISDSEGAEWGDIQRHVINGLLREDLVEDEWAFGGPEQLRSFSRLAGVDFPSAGLDFTLTPLGIELFTGAHGVTKSANAVFLGTPDTFQIEEPIELGTGFRRFSDLPGYTPPNQAAKA